MNSLTSTINVNVNSQIKREANAILNDLGLNMSIAINMFLTQVIKRNGKLETKGYRNVEKCLRIS